MEPMGEALPNQEIFRRLAAAMGLADPLLFESDAALLARILAATPYGGTFADLAETGTVRLYATPRMQFPSGFPTPPGRITGSTITDWHRIPDYAAALQATLGPDGATRLTAEATTPLAAFNAFAGRIKLKWNHVSG